MSFEPIQSMVLHAVDQHSDRVAVRDPSGELTYAQLRWAAAGIACDLQEHGAGPGSIIPVLAHDRREVIAAVLGILQIGGVFVPVDPLGPQLRTSRIIASLDPRWAVVSAATDRSRSEGALGHETIRLAVDLDQARGEPEPVSVSPDDPAYIFYTSGSTGRPKGIVGRLGAIDHYVRWESDLVGVAPSWRVGHLTSPAFDAMLRDMFVPLCSGASVCVPPGQAALNAPALARWIADESIDLLHCVPSVFRALIRAAPAGALEGLQYVALAGEQLDPDDVREWYQRHGNQTRLINLYGPSETTMTKTYHPVEPADAERDRIPVGRPMPDTEILVLDAHRRRCQTGQIGEIHIRTPYRSLGYHADPGRTAEVFVPNPLTGDDEDIVYRTGDFGRILANGELEFLGRRDNQVKIGGVRVHLEDVEHALRELPGVREAAAVLVDDSDPPWLCAFVQPFSELDTDAAIRHLHTLLPESAVPSRLIPLARFPRTISGKIDRKALPPPLPGKFSDDRPAAGCSATELTIARMAADVLRVEQLDVRANFLEAGGRSLLVMHLLARISEGFGVEVPLHEFLADPTVGTLARLVGEASNSSG